MVPNPLRPLTQRDLSNEVVHLTARRGERLNDRVEPAIRAMDAPGRLERILRTRELRAYQVFHEWRGLPVVCFSEATYEGLEQLVHERYEPWGLGFTKTWIFHNGGGPTSYVRGDLWDALMLQRFEDDFGETFLSFATPYWPGLAEDDPNAPRTARRANEWAHEREWRVPRSWEDPVLHFDYPDVAVLVAPHREGLHWMKGVAPAGALDHAKEYLFEEYAGRWVWAPE